MPLPPVRLRLTPKAPDPDKWIEHAREMAESMHDTVWTQPEGEALRSFLDSQTHLITSLPLDAARQIQAMALEVVVNGERYNQIAEAIMSVRDMTKASAERIARTEVARTSAGLTQVRAMSVGSPGYFWRTAEDGNVRPIHRRLANKFILWSKPPIAAANGTRAHAGCIYNCRCWAEPVLPGVNTTDSRFKREPRSRFRAEAVNP